MLLQISYEVSDRAEVEKQAGLHAALYFRCSDTGPSLSVTGTASVAESLHQAKLNVIDDEIGFAPVLAQQLLRAVCERGWHAIVQDGMAAVGASWRDFDGWLEQASFIDVQQVDTAIRQTVTQAIQKRSGQCKNEDSAV